MIREISVNNYKSIVALDMPLARFNLLIGANGCGKSNILESIALAAAASANKLEREYFDNRGIRFVEPVFMLPAFEDVEAQSINIEVSVDAEKESRSIPFDIRFNETAKPPRWESSTKSTSFGEILNQLKNMTKTIDDEIKNEAIKDENTLKIKQEPKKLDENTLKIKQELKKLDEKVTSFFSSNSIPEDIRKIILETQFLNVANKDVVLPEDSLKQYMIYSLEESRLRLIDDNKQIYPLGNRGEGLLPYLKELSQKPNGADIIKEINENLKLLDWFDEMTIPSGQLSSEVNIRLHDNYLRESLEYFDQRSTNEGFLYLLFYLTLIISDETPSFFAIENIDASFNPKLCKEVVRKLIQLAKKHNKQIIATTHNPAVLDALDLEDQDVKLHVVRRSVDGYTKINSVELKSKLNMPLSKAWTDGLLGGLPDNF